MKEKLIHFFKRETVLCAAFALAILSMFFVHPDGEYAGYVDFRTLAILFCLMGVMAGLQKSGVFRYVAQALLSRVGKAWQLVLTLSCSAFSPVCWSQTTWRSLPSCPLRSPFWA